MLMNDDARQESRSVSKVILGTFCGMAIYWSLTTIGVEVLPPPPDQLPGLEGAVLFLMLFGPFAVAAFVTLLVLAFRGVRLWRLCATGAGIAIASLIIMVTVSW